jgi:hypothetical protein
MRYPHDMPFLPKVIYGIATSSLIAALHIITAFLGKRVGHSDADFTYRQHMAVHSCLAFYFITELESYYAYNTFKKVKTCTGFLKNLPFTDIDPSFKYPRCQTSYMTELRESWRHYLDGDYRPSTLWQIIRPESQIVVLVSLL